MLIVGLLGSEAFEFRRPRTPRSPTARPRPWVTAGDVLSDIDTEEAADKWGHTAGQVQAPPRGTAARRELPLLHGGAGLPEPSVQMALALLTYLLKLSPDLPSWTIQAKRTNNMGPLHWRIECCGSKR